MRLDNCDIPSWKIEAYEEIYENDLNRVKSWENVARLDELVVLLDSLIDDERFLSLAAEERILENDGFKYDIKKIPFQYAAAKALGFVGNLPLFLPRITKRLIEVNGLVATLAIIQSSFVEYSNHYLTDEEDKIIKLSNIMNSLTFFVEDFDNKSNVFVEHDYDYYYAFFKQLHHVYWEDKEARKLENDIYNFFTTIITFKNLSARFSRTFGIACIYLMGCNALKCGRSSVNCEDVVVAYLTCFKLLLNDYRFLIYDLYDDEKWSCKENYR